MRNQIRLAALALLPACLGAQDAAPWSFHAQLTYQLQGHGAFDAPYEGQNSLQNRKEIRGSYTTTLYLGHRLWEGGEVYGDAELQAGGGQRGPRSRRAAQRRNLPRG